MIGASSGRNEDIGLKSLGLKERRRREKIIFQKKKYSVLELGTLTEK